MNAPDRVVVRLASPALFPGADGGSDPGVATDEHGLPHLPRHRLAACLREGAQAALVLTPDLAWAVDELFGRPGSHGPDRILRLGHAGADPQTREVVARALAGRAAPERATLRRALTRARTVVEAGTAVGTDGAPEPGRLRNHRALLPGTTLTAPLTWARTPSPEHWLLLARACLATDRIGARTRRGRGRVEVRLAGPDTPDADATTLALASPPGKEEGPGRGTGPDGEQVYT
ncbi:hypothetical protein IDM40_13485 [Nocardiopsis sp. HNM0947]|uniref:Uncharacterized protein n=1 Tax=Nocardiopsis coralli TaxID=2772213 RepID=A0ABR9P786_9ACTN|nr:hypothetical protein [Nocardiopsis coralli]MBE2999714.1 hypothetical protein [Nocardiopsis coralli]